MRWGSFSVCLSSAEKKKKIYLVSICIISTLLCGELVELKQRAARKDVAKYLIARSGEGGRSDCFDVGDDVIDSDLVFDVSGNVADDEDKGEEGETEALADELKKLKTESTKVASLCSGVPTALFRLWRRVREPVLLYHVDEGDTAFTRCVERL